MRCTKGGTVSGGSTQLRYVSPHACMIATLTLMLSACLETSSGIQEMADRTIPLAPRSFGPVEESATPENHSEDFWDAIADLDLEAARHTVRTGPENRFADAVGALAAGDDSRAERDFAGMSVEKSDPNVATASQLMFAATLLYEHRWSELQNLTANLKLGTADSQSVSGVQRWGNAFAELDSQTIDFPNLPVTLPVRLTQLGTPTIKVRVNGHDYRFWLDTGSSITVLSSEVAEQAGVSILGVDTLTIATFAGVAPARPAVAKRIELGSIVLTNVPAIIIESRLMRVQSTAQGVPPAGLAVDGIIGWDTIRKFDVLLDYENGRVTLQRPDSLGTRGTPAQNLIWVGRPFIEVRTKSGTTLHFTLDTGAQASFLSAFTLKKAGAVAGNSDARPYGIARSGGQKAQAVSALTVNVGGRSLSLRGLIVYYPSSSNLVACDGILGSDIAQFGSIRIDATNGLFSVGV